MKKFEDFSSATQKAIEELRLHLLSIKSLNLLNLLRSIWIFFPKVSCESHSYCIGFLISSGCDIREVADAYCYVKNKNFWLKE